MKKTTVILAHSTLKDMSVINKTIMEKVKAARPDIMYRHLDALYPDGKINVEAEQKALLESDVIVMQFPIQWYFVPALMKSYMDSVWAFGFSFGPGGDKLKGKKILVAASTGSNEASYNPGGKPENYNKQFLKNYLFAFENAAPYMGMEYLGLVSAHAEGNGPEHAAANKKIAEAAAERILSILGGKENGCKVL